MPDHGYEEISAFPPRSVHHCIPLAQPDKQIRVLELYPVQSSTPATTSALHGNIRVLGVPTDEEYSALSYVWTQEDPGALYRQNLLVIHCDDHEHETLIGPNCWSALWHIRKTKKPIGIWVDSICIDQRNKGEKIQQLPLMQSIYASAFVTYFWLGEAGKGTDEAMKFFSTSPLLTDSSGTSRVITAIFKLIIQFRTRQAGLAEILSRPWITRLWTLQECLLSRNGVLICGENSVAFAEFACVLQLLVFFYPGSLSNNLGNSHTQWLNLANLVRWWVEENKENGLDQPRDCGMEMPKWYDTLGKARDQLELLVLALKGVIFVLFVYYGVRILSISTLYATQPEQNHPRLLQLLALAMLGLFIVRYESTNWPKQLGHITTMVHHPIVEELRNREASDPKDLFYGIVGILGDDTLKGAGNLSIEILYRKLCTSLIKRTRSLDILLLADAHTNNLKGQPSWVIDWRSKVPQVLGKAVYYHEMGEIRRYFGRDPSYVPLLRVTDALQELPLSPFGSSPFKIRGAMPGTKPIWEFREHCMKICIYGIFLTSVSSHFAPRQSDITGIGPRMLNSVLYDAISDMSGYKQYCVNNLIAVLTMEKYRTVETSLRNWWHTLRESTSAIDRIEWLEGMLSKDKSLQSGHHLLISTLWKEKLSAVCCESAAMYCGGMAFAGTSVLAGDAVVLVSGLAFPLVLRPSDSRRFKLIGPIFMPGIMNGELQEMVKMIPLDEMVLM